MGRLINRNGMEVQGSAKAVFEELMRGTGFVMGERLSLFIETKSITEKAIVLSETPDSKSPGRNERFAPEHFKVAWERFLEWGQSK